MFILAVSLPLFLLGAKAADTPICASKLTADNSGHNYNTLGYYGEGVILGDKNVTGTWLYRGVPVAENSDENGTVTLLYDPGFFKLYPDGTGLYYAESYIDAGVSNVISYGVSKDGLHLIISDTSKKYENLFHLMAKTDDCTSPTRNPFTKVEESCFILNHRNHVLYKEAK